MISIQNTNSNSVGISELIEKLNAHTKNVQHCETFFNLYSKPWIPIEPHDLEMAQYEHESSFSNTFSCISENHLEQWKEKYRIISEDTSLIDTYELDLLKIQIASTEKINKVFCEKFIKLMKENAGVFLNKQGSIFFFSAGPIGVIGECHCVPSMKRESRNAFSYNLIRLKIVPLFPDKKNLSIASIGAGGCFHELEFQSLASEKGYSISEWNLVDPDLRSSVVKDFTTMVKWISPSTTVITVKQKADEYFTGLQNSTNVPDVFLFFDVDKHIREAEVQAYAQKMNHLSLFANFSDEKKSFHYSNVTQ